MCFLPGMGEARRFNYRGGPLGGGGSGGECSGLPVDPVLNQRQVVGFHFDADRVESLHQPSSILNGFFGTSATHQSIRASRSIVSKHSSHAAAIMIRN